MPRPACRHMASITPYENPRTPIELSSFSTSSAASARCDPSSWAAASTISSSCLVVLGDQNIFMQGSLSCAPNLEPTKSLIQQLNCAWPGLRCSSQVCEGVALGQFQTGCSTHIAYSSKRKRNIGSCVCDSWILT